MSTPRFLDLDYAPMNDVSSLPGIVDVQDIIDALPTLLVTNLGYTNPSGNLFVSPVDTWGRSFQIDFTRIDDETLEFAIKNGAGTTQLTRRIKISNGGTNVEIYSGYYHLCIVSHHPSDTVYDEHCEVYIVETSPDEPSDIPTYLIFGGYRNGSSSIDGAYSYYHWYLGGNDPTGVSVAHRTFFHGNGAGTPFDWISAAGTYLMSDPIVWHNYAVVGNRWIGRLPHHFSVSRALTMGTTIQVPISDTEQTNFYVQKKHDAGGQIGWQAIRKTQAL